MIKRGLISGILLLLIVSVEAYFSQNWSHIYYVCGTMGLISIGLALAYFIDSLILGNKGTFSSKKETRKIGRIDQSKGFLIMAIPNLTAALVYIVI
ncbi:hypothetical protein COJ37_22930 [Bacillus cereus]|uniref:DUF5316 family protein n=1 Tax=Bacillus cereus TaxID=1396 RepID=UPI000BF47FCD|nr:DUF5316 family protein [Bacillus cereus]WIK98696.1 hypothetical protein QPL86_28440 [Bacillus bombysepticus]NKX61677.1 DUF5316 domain-containing protein [Bacillus cereus]PFC50662.1 hypothetical protein CN297_17245 [Bacillus cereus]PFJ86948.1 hypothetical protein COJ11_27665 [Bacillus cereus]PFK54757.1 hypothetical protein COJ14_10870 [Bacillus cereus]